MQAFLVIDFFQKLTDRSAGLGQIAILVAIYFLVIQCLGERFAGGIVPRGALTGHADANVVASGSAM